MSIVRSRWESDKRAGFAWLVRDMSLPFSPQYINRVSKKNGWKKANGFDTAVKPRSEQKAAMRVKMIEDAMFKAALGLNEVTDYLVASGEVVTITRKIPPSVEAQIFLLSRSGAATG